MQGQTLEITIPLEAYQELRRSIGDGERQELRTGREPFQSAEAQKLLEEAIVPYLAEEQTDIDGENADYNASGEINRGEQTRDESGQFL